MGRIIAWSYYRWTGVYRPVSYVLKLLIVSGLLLSALMLYHKQLRHFVLLPSCMALIGGMMLAVMNWNQG